MRKSEEKTRLNRTGTLQPHSTKEKNQFPPAWQEKTKIHRTGEEEKARGFLVRARHRRGREVSHKMWGCKREKKKEANKKKKRAN